MLSFLSILTSVKDYVEITHKLIETDPDLFQIKSYDEIGSLLTYFILSIKELLIGFFSLAWLKNIWTLPIIVPEIASSMISEISILDGSFHNIFNVLENPLDYGQQNVFVSLFQKFFIGFLNSIFLVLPTSVSHIITLRRFIMQGVEIGYIAGLGTIAGNILWIASILFGWRFFVIPWLSFDIFRYLFGFILLVKYLWDCTKERKILLEEVNTSKVFLLNFLLALTEQTCIYPFITNISFSPESSILETFPTGGFLAFIALHSSYLLGIFVGSFTLLLLSYWFWENPAFTFFLWLQTNPKFNLTKRGYYKFFNNFFTYLTMLAAIGSIPYYGLDYTLTKPLGLVPQDRIITEKPLGEFEDSNRSESMFKEVSFLSVQPSNLDLRMNDGNPRPPRRRWKERFKKYEAFDISLYDQGNYDFLTIEDLNYGFDRFWFKRKIRNHSTSFRVFPKPIMRDLKKKLSSPLATIGQEESNKEAFFTLLFEQYYHPNFHRIINKNKIVPVSKDSLPFPFPYLLRKPLLRSPFGDRGEEGSLFLGQSNGKNSSGANFFHYAPYPSSGSPKEASQAPLVYNKTPRKDHSIFGIKKNTIGTNWKTHSEFSALKKFVRKVNTRIKQSEIAFDLNQKSNSLIQANGAVALSPAAYSELNVVKNEKQRAYSVVPGLKKATTKNNFIYSKLWKHLYSNIWRGSYQTTTPSYFMCGARNPFRSLSKNIFSQETNIHKKLTILMKKENQYKSLQKGYTIEESLSASPSLGNKQPILTDNFKKTLSREKLSKKDRQILRYRTRLLQSFPISSSDAPSSDFIKSSSLSVTQKRADVVSRGERSGVQNTSTIVGANSKSLFYPLNFYLQKEQAFNKKLKFYGSTIFRKFSVGNNAPYFRTILKRGFYYYKKNLRWKRTQIASSLRKGLALRKSSRNPLKLIKTNSLRNKSGQIRPRNVVNPSYPFFITPYQGPSGRSRQGTASLRQVYPEGGTPYGSFAGSSPTSFSSLAYKDEASIRTRNEQPIGVINQKEASQNLTYPLLTKPTHFYSDTGKRYSRYRFQIYKDVLQHWYYTPFNRLLLKLDIDAFINRQPRNHFLTKKEEQLLHLRRILLSEHYDTLRWYTFMENYKSMKNTIGGNKSFASRIYNQQFQGTFKKIRHLFAVTPSQTKSSPAYTALSGYQGKVALLSGFDNNLAAQSKSRFPSFIGKAATSAPETPSLLTFDQPLYNEYPNFTPNEIQRAKKINKKTGKIIFKSIFHEELFLDKNKKLLDLQYNGEDLITQSTLQVGQYLLKNQNSEYLKTLINENKYSELLKFLYKKTDIKRFEDLEKLTSLQREPSTPLIGFNFLPSKEVGEESIALRSKKGSRKSRTFSFGKPSGPNGRAIKLFSLGSDTQQQLFHEELWFQYLRQSKKRLNNKKFLQKYLKYKVELSEQKILAKEKQLEKRLKNLNLWLTPITFLSKTSFSSINEERQKIEGNNILLTRGLLKSLKKGALYEVKDSALKGSFAGKSKTEQIKKEEDNSFALSQRAMFTQLSSFVRKQVKTEQKVFISVETIQNILGLISPQNVEIKENQIDNNLKKNYYQFLNKINYKGKIIFSKVQNAFSKKTKPLYYFLQQRPDRMKSVFWKQRQKVKEKIKKQRKLQPAPILKTIVPREKNKDGTSDIITKSFNYYQEEDSSLMPLNEPLEGVEGDIVFRYKDIEQEIFEFDLLENGKKLSLEKEENEQSFENVENTTNRFKKSENNSIFNESAVSGSSPILTQRGYFVGQNFSPWQVLQKRVEGKKGPLSSLRGDRDKQFLSYLFPFENKYQKSKKKGFAGIALKKVKFMTKEKIKKMSQTEKKRIIKSGGLVSEFIKNLPSSNSFQQPQTGKGTATVTSPSSPKVKKAIEQKDIALITAKESDSSFSFTGKDFEIPNKKSYRKKLRLKNKFSYVKKIQNYPTKKYKILKRRIYKKAKLQKFAKQLTRLQSNIQLQIWWWQTYLPKFELKVENLTLVSSSSDKLLQTPLKESISKNESTDSGQNGVNPPTYYVSPLQLGQQSRGSFLFGQEEKENKKTSSFINNLYKNLLIKETTSVGPFFKGDGEGKKALFNSRPSERGSFAGPSGSFNKEILINSLPFYAGWDDSLRKLIVTNRTLSRRDAGFTLKNLNLFTNLKPLEEFSPNNDLNFTEAPVFGLNESLFLYLKNDIPFKTYSIEQYNPNLVSFYTPIAWRRFEFRHSILNNWLKNNLFEEFPNSIKGEVNHSSFFALTKGVTHAIIPTGALQMNSFGVLPDTGGEEQMKNFENNGKITKLSSKQTKLQDKWNSALISRKIINSLDKNEQSFKTISLKQSKQKFNVLDVQATTKKTEKRIFQKFIIRRMKKHKFNFEKKITSPNLNLKKSYGTLLIDVLPSHYLSLLNNESRLPRYRYLKYKLIKNKNSKEISLATTEYNNSIKKLLDIPISNENKVLTKSFTLRKKNKPKRKFHRKLFNTADGLITPQRRKFLIFSEASSLQSKEKKGTDNSIARPLSKNARAGQQNSQKAKTSLKGGRNEKLRWRPINENEFYYSQTKKNIKVDTNRRRKLRTRVVQQVYKQINRFEPRYGGYMWPGSYSKLSLTSFPYLENREITSNESIKRTLKYKEKKTLPPDLLVGGSNYKYLIKKHNILVIKKKLEKAQRSNKIRERTNILKSNLQKS